MLKTTVTIKGAHIDVKSFIEKSKEEIKDKLIELGHQTTAQMKTNIDTGIHRNGSTGKLAGAIDMTVEETLDTFSVGIGNIEKLNRLAPYWFVVNYGVSYPKGSSYEDAIKNIDSLPKFIPGNGNFAPMGSFGGQAPDGQLAGTGVGTVRWGVGTGKFGMSAKNPINPINYIEKTSAWLSQMWGDFIKS